MSDRGYISITDQSAPLGPQWLGVAAAPLNAKTVANMPVLAATGPALRSEPGPGLIKEDEKLWKIKPLTNAEMAELPLPDCGGHECRDCIGAFREFWIVKAKFLELRKALMREKQAMNETIEEVTEMETDYEKRLEIARVELQVEREQRAKLAADLEYERGLRMADFYKAERAGKETEETMDDMKQYRAHMKNMGMEIEYLRQEHDAFADMTRRSELTKAQLLAQVSAYEQQVNELDRANIDLRTKMHRTSNMLMEVQQECDGLKLQMSRASAAAPRFRPSKSSMSAAGDGGGGGSSSGGGGMDSFSAMGGISSQMSVAMRGGIGDGGGRSGCDGNKSVVRRVKGSRADGGGGGGGGGKGKGKGKSKMAQSGTDAVSSLGQLALKSGWKSNAMGVAGQQGSMNASLFSTGPGLGVLGSPQKSLRMGGMMEDSMWSKII